jgi:predicted phosphate transport protein (TIGR00153 family)
MALQGIVRWLLPKEDHFYDYLEALGTLGLDAANALAAFKEGQTSEQVRDTVQDIEHKADAEVRKMEDALARTFVTPIDREDLHKLCNELDNVVDITNLAARACAVYGVKKPTPEMVKLMDVLVRCTQNIKSAVPMLRKHQYANLIEMSRSLRQLEKDADTIFRSAVSDLFANDAVDAKELLRRKEVLQDLEGAIDHCDGVAEMLSNLAVKHG